MRVPDGVVPDPVLGGVAAAVECQLLPLVVKLLFGARHVHEVLIVRGVLHHRVVDSRLSGLFGFI